MDTLEQLPVARVPSELIELQSLVHLLNETLGSRAACFYCGEPSECEDHVIPHSLLYHEGIKRRGWEVDTLPACNECNTSLGSEVFDTLGERRAYLCKAYRRRYARELKGQAWTREELDALGYTLRTGAERFNGDRERVERRLATLSGAILVPIVPSVRIVSESALAEPILPAYVKPKRVRRRRPIKTPPSLRWFVDANGLWEYRL